MEMEVEMDEQSPGTSSGTESGKIENYFIQYKIGLGTYGIVFKGINRKTGEDVAIKKIVVIRERDCISKEIVEEIATLRHLNKSCHPHIVRLLDVCYGLERYEDQILYLVFEYIGQDLEEYIKNHPTGFDTSQIQKFILDILLGVDFLHNNKVIHRDLKPANLMVTCDGRIKLADFGLAKFYDISMKLLYPVVVTLRYRAPEILMDIPCSTPIDIWSVGCIILELYNLSFLLNSSCSEFDQLCQIFSIIGKPSKEDWPTENVSIDWNLIQVAPPTKLNILYPDLPEMALDLVMKMLVFNPNKRITASQALIHPFCVYLLYGLYSQNL